MHWEGVDVSVASGQLWGMPLELAVTLVAVGGAIVGSLITAAAAVAVARWQAQEQVKAEDRRRSEDDVAQRRRRLEDAVSALQAACVSMRRTNAKDFDRPISAREYTQLAERSVPVLTLSTGIAPDLGLFMREFAARSNPMLYVTVVATLWKVNSWLADSAGCENAAHSLNYLEDLVTEYQVTGELPPQWQGPSLRTDDEGID